MRGGWAPLTVVSDSSVCATCLGRPVDPEVSSQTRPGVAGRGSGKGSTATESPSTSTVASPATRSPSTRPASLRECAATRVSRPGCVAWIQTARSASMFEPTKNADASGASSAARSRQVPSNDPATMRLPAGGLAHSSASRSCCTKSSTSPIVRMERRPGASKFSSSSTSSSTFSASSEKSSERKPKESSGVASSAGSSLPLLGHHLGHHAADLLAAQLAHRFPTL